MGPKSIKTIENIYSPGRNALPSMAHCVGLPPPNTNRFEIWCVFRVQTQVACSRPCVALIPEFRVTTTCYRGHGAFVQKFRGIQEEQWPSKKGGWTHHLHPFPLIFLVQVVQYTPWKLTMYGIYWIILVYDQRFHQEMMTVEGKCLHGACTTHWAFLDHEQYLIWGFHVNVRGCGACWKQMPCAVCARCKIENPKTSSGIMIYRNGFALCYVPKCDVAHEPIW